MTKDRLAALKAVCNVTLYASTVNGSFWQFRDSSDICFAFTDLVNYNYNLIKKTFNKPKR